MDSIKEREWQELSQRLNDLEENIERTEGMIRAMTRARQTLEKQLDSQKTEFKEVCERLRNLAIELNQ